MKLIVMAKLYNGSMKQVLLDPEKEGVVRRLIQVLHDEGKLPLSSKSWEVKECEGDNLRQIEQCSGCDWVDVDYKVRQCAKCKKFEQFD